MAAPITAHCICLSRWLNLIRKNDRIGQTFVRINNDKCFIRCLNTGQKHLAKHPANSLQKNNKKGTFPISIAKSRKKHKLKVTYSRSSGPGGQHVNKVNTKAEVRFHVHTAEWIPEEVRNEIMLKSKTRINKAGELIITSEVSRSQQQNLEDCLQKISEIISEASQRPPEPTEEDIALRAKRLQKRNTIRLKDKKSHSATKQARQVFD